MKIIPIVLIAIYSFTFPVIRENSIDQKILNIFNKIFNGAENIKWTEEKKYAKAVFTLNEVPTQAYFDYDGNLQETVKYYSTTNLLPTNIIASINKKYPDFKIWGVVEVAKMNNVEYSVTLLSENHWVKNVYSGSGYQLESKRYKRTKQNDE